MWGTVTYTVWYTALVSGDPGCLTSPFPSSPTPTLPLSRSSPPPLPPLTWDLRDGAHGDRRHHAGLARIIQRLQDGLVAGAARREGGQQVQALGQILVAQGLRGGGMRVEGEAAWEGGAGGAVSADGLRFGQERRTQRL